MNAPFVRPIPLRRRPDRIGLSFQEMCEDRWTAYDSIHSDSTRPGRGFLRGMPAPHRRGPDRIGSQIGVHVHAPLASLLLVHVCVHLHICLKPGGTRPSTRYPELNQNPNDFDICHPPAARSQTRPSKRGTSPASPASLDCIVHGWGGNYGHQAETSLVNPKYSASLFCGECL